MSKKNNPKADDFKLETTSFEIDDNSENFDLVDNFDFSEYEKPKDKTMTANKKVVAKKKSGKKGFVWIIIIASITIVVAAGIYFFVLPGIKNSSEKVGYAEEKENIDELVSQEDIEDLEENVENFDTEDQPALEKNDLKESAENDQLSDDATVKEVKEEKAKIEEVTPASKNKNNWGLTLPCYIISHSAFADENIAKEEKKKLTSQGFKCDYYWIPDVTPGGKELYKIYVGPYKSQKDAEKVIASVKKVKPTAYIQQITK